MDDEPNRKRGRPLGMKHTEATKQKISVACKGQKHPDAWRKLQSDTMKKMWELYKQQQTE